MSDFNYQKLYDRDYYTNMVPDIPYDRESNDGHWLKFFNAIADKLSNYLSLHSVLDVGCAKGFLVEAFHNRGIISYGFDFSNFAVTSIREDLKSLVFTASAENADSFTNFQEVYDLITCIEVVEHMPRQEAVDAIKNMCEHSKNIFFSSTGDDFAEPTHLTVLPRIEWLKIFSLYDFYPDYKFDISDLIPHGVLLKKAKNVTICINDLTEYNELSFEHYKQSQLRIENLIAEITDLKQEARLKEFIIEQFRLQLHQSQSDLESLKINDKHSKLRIEGLIAEIISSEHKVKLEESIIEQSRLHLQRTQSDLELLKSHISWMETSKFWKLRSLFVKLKCRENALSAIGILKFIKKISLSINRRAKTLPARILSLLPFSGKSLYGKINFAEPSEYAHWIACYEPNEKELKQQNQYSLFEYQPLLSVITPIYKLPLPILQETLESVLKQTYRHWELCIAFASVNDTKTIEYLKSLSLKDSRIKLKIMPENLGISGNSNVSLSMASGEFLVLLDHDDLLAPSAFYEVIHKLNEQPDLDFIYSDKDCISANSIVRSRLLLKPDWSPEILYSVNYLTHLCIARREIVEQIGGFRSETDGAQDWDIFLRISEQTSRIARLTSVLYHWRIIEGSTSLGMASKPYAAEAQLRSIQEHLIRLKLPAKVSPHPECGFKLEWQMLPKKVSIIIDGNVPWETLSNCIMAIDLFSNPNLHNAKVVISASVYHLHTVEIENLIKTINLPIHWLLVNEDNSHLTVLSESARQHVTDVILFVSGQVKRFQPGWIEELSGWVIGHPKIGFASALVITESDIVVEAGLIVDKYGNGSPLFRGEKLFSWEMFGGALWYRNCTASSPWAIAFNYQHYQEIGGLDTESASLLQSMIKLCQASNNTNKRGLCNPHARAYLSSLPDDDIPKFDESLAEDTYFHPAFSSVVPLKLKNKKDGDK